jgi:osmoprotectant transport system permease protein
MASIAAPISRSASTSTSVENISIGSKSFTESVVLGELLRLRAERAGVAATHRQELGGSRILFEALRQGEIDAYPEYSGTLIFELLGHRGEGPMMKPQIDAALAELGLAASAPLGFENTYAIGMRRERAEALELETISDLGRHPELKLAFSSEFMDRRDGWPGLANAYALPQRWVRGMDHDLAYRALESGEIDAIDLYSTDADIAYYDLKVLKDDRRYFPEYLAIVLYRLDLEDRAPAFLGALQSLAGRIDAPSMIAMNAGVKIEHKSESQAAADFLGLQIVDRRETRSQRIAARTWEHITLVGISLAAAIIVAIPLGIIGARHRRLGTGILAVSSVMQTLPSLALFVFMIPFFGIGAAPAAVALFLYSLLPIVRNTHSGLTGIDPSLRDAAEALGLPRATRLRWIELPLASHSILAGIKTAAVINVGTATLAALIGAGGYGQPILTGIRLDDTALILEGAVPAALLAMTAQGLFGLLERWLGWEVSST